MPLDQPLATQPTAPGAPNGEAAAARDARRMERLAALERLRARADRISEKLCDLIEDKLPAEEREPFARVADPVLAFTRVATAIRRIAALEGQIDEEDEQRAARLAEKAAAEAKAAAQAAQAPVDRRIHMRASRRIARESMRDAVAARDSGMRGFDREALLNDLTSDLDDADYADNMDLILAQIATELDAIIGPPDDDCADDDDDDDDEDDEDDPPGPVEEVTPASETGTTYADIYAAAARAGAALDRALQKGSG